MKTNRSTQSRSALLGCPCCTIIPAHMLKELAENGTPHQRRLALSTLLQSERLRGQREMLASLGAVSLATPTGQKRRTVYDAKQQPVLPGKLVRGEGAKTTKDTFVSEAYDYSGVVYDFYKTVFKRTSVDDRGMRLDSTVHYREDPREAFDNAFWNGQQMIYGDGDGEIFGRFTECLDVIGHEITHGVTQFEAGLAYQGQSGALNESLSDVFGSLVKQWKLKQSAAKADWLIGAGLFEKSVKGVALRSMKAPGTAYDDPRLGKDPQPAHMKDYDHTAGDNGGVHTNSGIPNYAFYLAATAIGGNAWDKTGKIWYDTLCNRLRPDSDFAAAANATVKSATDLFGANGAERKAVQAAWKNVGVIK